MSTNRSKTSHGKSIRRSSPNARIRRRRIHQQPIQGRYPVLPPIGHSWTPLGPYQPVGHQGFMIPAMTYPMLPYQQMVPYVPQSGVPTNTMLPSLPQPCMAAPPTSMMCYYVPWLGVYQQTESDNSITELPPDELVEEENDQIPEGSFSYMHQTLMYHDSVVWFTIKLNNAQTMILSHLSLYPCRLFLKVEGRKALCIIGGGGRGRGDDKKAGPS